MSNRSALKRWDIYDEVVLADGPIGYWPLTASDKQQDLSGNGRHLTTTWGTPAFSNNAFIGTSAALASTCRVPQSMYSMEVWVKPNNTDPGGCSPLSDYSGSGVMYYFLTNQEVRIVHGGTNTKTGTILPINEWSHLFTRWSGTTRRLYVNGTQVWSGDISGAPGLGQKTRISSYSLDSDGPNRLWRGWLRRAAWYSTVLTDTRIAAHYQAGLRLG